MATRIEECQYRATTGAAQGLGRTPQEAVTALLQSVSDPEAATPIVIWPFNRGDAFFSDAQQARLQELKARDGHLSVEEEAEREQLVAEALEATITRTQMLPLVKS